MQNSRLFNMMKFSHLNLMRMSRGLFIFVNLIPLVLLHSPALCYENNPPAMTSAGPGTKLTNHQQAHRNHPRMSCYACSTMDYENSVDNVCRSLRHQQVNTRPHAISDPLHFPHKTNLATTTAASSSLTDLNGHSPHQENLISGSGGSYDDSYLEAATSPANYMSSSDHFDETSYGQAISTTQPTTTPTLNSNTTSPAQYQHRIFQNRTVVPGNFIRTRRCLDDENFCSIVSVVRIEFVQDNIYSKFWALERNCSKSCNTGCMVIGERVRLRVCSQCCRTPDCNVGSGATVSANLISAQFKGNFMPPLAFILLILTSMATLNTMDQYNRRWGATFW